VSPVPPRRRTRGVRWLAVLAVAGSLTGCTSGHGPTAPGSPTNAGSATSTAPSASTTTSPSPSPTTGSSAVIAGLPYVPTGFTLPPGAVVADHDVVGTQTEIVLTAPSAAIAVAYLRQEITGLGYGQRGQPTSNGMVAYAYRLGSSVVSVAGSSADGHDVTALVFQND
jgi:hypothetical protein